MLIPKLHLKVNIFSKFPSLWAIKTILIVSTIFAFLFSRSGYAQQIDLGTASQYSGFFFGNVSKLPDIKGRLALQGDLSIGGTSIGGSIPKGSTQPSLVVGGNISAFTGGSIWADGHNGSWGVYAGSKNASVPKYLDLRQSDSPVDFEAEKAYLTMLSQQLHDMPPTGVVSQSYSTVTLTGGNRDIEVFNLTADQVKNTLNFALKNVKSTATLILNVASDTQRQVKLGITMKVFTDRNTHVLFNFYDADVLSMTNVAVLGSVLAPYACVKNSSGQLNGTIVAANWDSSMSIGYAPFAPTH